MTSNLSNLGKIQNTKMKKDEDERVFAGVAAGF
jgi:hypothetical protein